MEMILYYFFVFFLFLIWLNEKTKKRRERNEVKIVGTDAKKYGRQAFGFLLERDETRKLEK